MVPVTIAITSTLWTRFSHCYFLIFYRGYINLLKWLFFMLWVPELFFKLQRRYEFIKDIFFFMKYIDYLKFSLCCHKYIEYLNSSLVRIIWSTWIRILPKVCCSKLIPVSQPSTWHIWWWLRDDRVQVICNMLAIYFLVFLVKLRHLDVSVLAYVVQ